MMPAPASGAEQSSPTWRASAGLFALGTLADDSPWPRVVRPQFDPLLPVVRQQSRRSRMPLKGRGNHRYYLRERFRSSIAGAIGTTHTITQSRADVLVVVEDVVGVVRGLHVQPAGRRRSRRTPRGPGRGLRRRRGS